MAQSSSASESPIKHTAGGEMPDPSAQEETLRRIQGVAIVASNELRKGAIYFLPVLAATIGAGVFFFLKQRQQERS